MPAVLPAKTSSSPADRRRRAGELRDHQRRAAEGWAVKPKTSILVK
jgi:hypothetical protein